MYNVTSYGAVGDGVADDTAGIQDALDAAALAGGGIIEIPVGFYRLTDYLTVRTGTTILAYGAYIYGTGSHSLLRNFSLAGPDSYPGYSGNSNITVQGGIWDNRAQLAGTDDMNNCITFNHGRNITVRDVTVRNVGGYHAIEMNSVDGGAILNCRAEGYVDNSTGSVRQFSEAFQVDVAKTNCSTIGPWDNTPARNILIDGCYAGPAVDGSGLGSWGALAGSHTVPPGGFYTGIRVVNCTLLDGSLLYGIQAAGWRDSLISGNTLVSTGGTGIYIHDGDKGVRVTGNVVRYSGSNCINATNQPGLIIEGNNLHVPSSNYCVYLLDSPKAVIQVNRMETAPTASVRLAGASTRAFVTGNKLIRGGVTTNAVKMDGTATECVVVGNDMRGEGWTGTTWMSASTSTPAITWSGTTASSSNTSRGDNLI